MKEDSVARSLFIDFGNGKVVCKFCHEAKKDKEGVSATRNVPGERKTFPGNVFRFYRSRNGELGTVTTQKRFKSFNYLIIQLSLR